MSGRLHRSRIAHRRRYEERFEAIFGRPNISGPHKFKDEIFASIPRPHLPNTDISALCSTCALLQSFIVQSWATFPKEHHLGNFEELVTKASFCPICAVLLASFWFDHRRHVLEKNGNSLPEQEYLATRTDIAILEGLRVNSRGLVLDYEGEPQGILTSGGLKDCVGGRVDSTGAVEDIDGHIIGRVELISGHVVTRELALRHGLEKSKVEQTSTIGIFTLLSDDHEQESLKAQMKLLPVFVEKDGASRLWAGLGPRGTFSKTWLDLNALPGSKGISPDITVSQHIFSRWAKLRSLRDWVQSQRRIFRSKKSRFGKVFVPTRLIDIGDLNSPVSSVKLVEGVKINQHEFKDLQYCALSHRWGGDHQLTTTKETVQDRLMDIPWSMLSETFKDAIRATRELGIQYLWIDSLCIVQGDTEDWKHESKRMGYVFQYATCTLAAHASPGFLNASLRKPLAVEMATTDGKGTILASPSGNFASDVEGSALTKRGWVLQERLLAPCTIHFTQGSLYLEEKTNSSPTILSESRQPALCSPRTSFSGGVLSTDALLSTTRYWFDIVERFCQCNLTKKDDKLIAIAGLVGMIHQSTGIPYFAGVWADRLHLSLLWRPYEANLTHPGMHRAPSWSWAALDGPIRFLPRQVMARCESEVQLLNIISGHDSSDGITNLIAKDFTLRLNASIKPVFISAQFISGDRAGNLLGDGIALWEAEQPHPKSRFRIIHGRERSNIGWAVLDENRSPDGARTEDFCMKTAYFQSGDESGYFVLLIQKIVGQEAFRRIGFGYLPVKRWFDGINRDWFRDVQTTTILLA